MFTLSTHNYLGSTTALDNKNLEIAEYNLLTVGHTSKSERSGVCVFYKNSLAWR